MSRRHVILAACAAAVIALVIIFLSRPIGTEPVNPALGDHSIDPAEAAMLNDSNFALPVDRSARWGFVLYDAVKLALEPNGDVNLHSADQVYICAVEHFR